MQIIRCFGLDRPGSAKASSIGRTSDPVAARRKWRRLSIMAGPLFRLEDPALGDLVHQAPEPVALRADRADDRLDLRLVDRSGRAARRVRQQLLGERAGELVLVVQEELLELVDVLELAAVGEDVGRIHRGALPVSLPADGFPLADAAVVLAPSADDVEA